MSDDELNIIGYHGTLARNVEAINSMGFKFDEFSIQSCEKSDIPCDLGSGIYVFLDNEDYKFKGIECAKNYVVNIWHSEVDFSVFEILISIDLGNQEVVDLDDESEMKYFMDVREKMIPMLNELFNHKKFKNSGAFRRGNCDGLVLELLFREKKIDPALVIKSTFTKYGYYKQSNFPNGTEACIRDLEIIKRKNICLEFKRN